MPVENVNYISDFNSAWPLGEDIRRFGDDHLRNIKRGIRNSFNGFLNSSQPGFEVMTMTQQELNSVVDRVLRAGDIMTGALLGYQVTPAADLEFVTKKWVQDLYDGVNPGGGSSYGFGITELYKSPEQMITADSTITLAHGLTRAPDEMLVRLRCTSTDAGYAVDDYVFIGGAQSNDTTNNAERGGITVAGNTTNLYLTTGSMVWANALSTGAFTELDLTKWMMTGIGYLIE